MSRERGKEADGRKLTQLVNSRGPWAEKKARLQTTGKHSFRAKSAVEADKERWAKVRISSIWNVDFCSYVVITIYLAL